MVATVSPKNSGQKFEADLARIECPEELVPRRLITQEQDMASGPPKTRSKISCLTSLQTKTNLKTKAET